MPKRHGYPERGVDSNAASTGLGGKGLKGLRSFPGGSGPTTGTSGVDAGAAPYGGKWNHSTKSGGRKKRSSSMGKGRKGGGMKY